MRQNGLLKKAYIPILVCFISVGLVFSFGLHAVQVEHVHFNAEHTHGDEHASLASILGEYMHLADKKLLLGIFFASTSLWTFLELRMSLWERLLYRASQVDALRRRRVLRIYRIFDYVRIFLRKGTIHTKAH